MATFKNMRGTREKSGMLLKEEGGEIDDNFNLAKILNCTDYKEFVWPMSKSLCKIKEWKCTWKLQQAKKKKKKETRH